VCLVDGLTHALPLVRVAVHASLVDVSAQVVVRQQYKNDGTARADCSYQFPVPARAAVTAFALVKEDGSRVVGIVQEKHEARITYDEAVKEGKLSSLMEQASPDSASPPSLALRSLPSGRRPSTRRSQPSRPRSATSSPTSSSPSSSRT